MNLMGLYIGKLNLEEYILTGVLVHIV